MVSFHCWAGGEHGEQKKKKSPWLEEGRRASFSLRFEKEEASDDEDKDDGRTVID